MYTCSECAKIFKRKDSLQRHMKFHGNLIRFRCEQCLSTFTRQDNFKRHVKSIHGMYIYKY